MSELPMGWTTTTLGELAEVIRGVTYKKEQAKASPSDGLLPLLRATNISQELDFDNLVYVPNRNVSDLQMHRQGDIVIAASSGSMLRLDGNIWSLLRCCAATSSNCCEVSLLLHADQPV